MSATLAKTLFLTHPDCLEHDMGAGHLESPARLRAILQRLRESGLDQRLEMEDAPLASGSDAILRAHAPELWKAIEDGAPTRGTFAVAPEAIMSPGTLRAILRGVGGAIHATEQVCWGAYPNAFVATRPPGHHATSTESMGFCFVNNAVIAAKHALDVLGLSRVAIVDIDVHHGNGTEEIVAKDPRIFMASTFGLGIYPGSGSTPLGPNMANLGLRDGDGSPPMRRGALAAVLSKVDIFAPELIIVSAGYDAHGDDPIGNLTWTDEDYYWWFERLIALANRHADGKLVAVLEGGYDTGALARGVEQSLLAMEAGIIR